MTLIAKRLAEIEEERIVTVSGVPLHIVEAIAHARHLIQVYDEEKVVDRPWYYEWAQTIDRLATALEGHIVEAIAT